MTAAYASLLASGFLLLLSVLQVFEHTYVLPRVFGSSHRTYSMSWLDWTIFAAWIALLLIVLWKSVSVLLIASWSPPQQDENYHC